MDNKRQQKVIGYRKPLYKLDNKQSGLDAIYNNGANNLYPYYVSNSVDGSSTGSMAHDRHSQYISGILLENDIEVNAKKELYLSDIISSAAEDLSIQNGFYIHVNISLDIEKQEVNPVRPSIIPFENCRISKEDDFGYWSRVFVSDNFFQKKALFHKTDDYKSYYRYNKRYEAVLSQVKDWQSKKELETFEEALRSFPGQVRFVKYTNEFPYPTSQQKAVLRDMESEFYISEYTNEQTINGFMGKVVVFVLQDDYESDNEFKKINSLEGWLGTDGSGGMFVQSMKNTDDPDKLLVVKQFKSQFDDKMFALTEKRLKRNIIGAFDNLPEALISAGDGVMFGTNPETFENLKNFYDENTKPKRDFLHKKIMDTLKISYEYRGIVERNTTEL